MNLELLAMEIGSRSQLLPLHIYTSYDSSEIKSISGDAGERGFHVFYSFFSFFFFQNQLFVILYFYLRSYTCSGLMNWDLVPDGPIRRRDAHILFN